MAVLLIRQTAGDEGLCAVYFGICICIGIGIGIGIGEDDFGEVRAGSPARALPPVRFR